MPLMLDVNPYGKHVAACLSDYFGSSTPWQRRLWAVGTVMSLKEVLEGSDAVQSSILSEASFKDLCHAAEIVVGQDPGVGGSEERRLLQASLHVCPRAGGSDYIVIRQMLERIEDGYLERWAQVLSAPSLPSPEKTARAIATHLLDLGFSDTYLHRWWTYRVQHEPSLRSLAELVRDTHALAHRPEAKFEVLVPFIGVPGSHESMPPNWRNSTEVSGWLRDNNFDPRELRQSGGFLLSISARDVHAGIQRISEFVERLSARVNLGSRSELQPADQVWIQKEKHPFPLRRSSRGVEIRALARENKLYEQSDTSNVDAALELLGSLNEGPPGPAVAGGWAALEALLLGPGDGGDRRIAGDRLATLVACSFPRAELTTLAYAHSNKGTDKLKSNIEAANNNRSRSALIAQAIINGQALALSSESDRLAEIRLRSLLSKPKLVLRDIEQYATRTLRRLYRQRNLVLHWGRMNAVCLRAALRTSAPLIGAGVDRIAHAWFTAGINPLELSARAKIRLELLETSGGVSPIDLLE
ncbi:MAG TPA: integrase [Thermoanaerobaculia bacterium]|nr:integrase [Thermoanaerobaculia bacterium]